MTQLLNNGGGQGGSSGSVMTELLSNLAGGGGGGGGQGGLASLLGGGDLGGLGLMNALLGGGGRSNFRRGAGLGPFPLARRAGREEDGPQASAERGDADKQAKQRATPTR
jgi:hypothetical protein